MFFFSSPRKKSQLVFIGVPKRPTVTLSPLGMGFDPKSVIINIINIIYFCKNQLYSTVTLYYVNRRNGTNSAHVDLIRRWTRASSYIKYPANIIFAVDWQTRPMRIADPHTSPLCSSTINIVYDHYGYQPINYFLPELEYRDQAQSHFTFVHRSDDDMIDFSIVPVRIEACA